MKFEEPIYTIYLCENCKQVTTDKTVSETLRHRLSCKLYGEGYGIIKFEHAYQLVDYYEEIIKRLRYEIAHCKCLKN